MKLALVPSLNIGIDGIPQPYIPLGLLSLKAVLLHSKICEVDLVDLNLALMDTGKKLSQNFYDKEVELLTTKEYNIIGFSCTSSSFHHVVSVAKRIKALATQILIVIGGPGPHSHSEASNVLRLFPCIDYLVQGEAESTFIRLVAAIQARTEPWTVPGVGFRVGNRIILNPHAAPLSNIDDLPIPDFEGLDITRYLYRIENYDEPILHIEQGRGCPFRCVFCCTSEYWQRHVRNKTWARVLKEMQTLNLLYQLKSFSLVNDCFNSNEKKLLEFCEAAEVAGVPFTWGCSLRIDRTTPDLLDRLWDAGGRGFFCGIESGSPRMQHLIGKNLNLTRAMNMLEYAISKGFHIITSFMIGFPQESKTDLFETMRCQKQCLEMGVARCQVNLLTPLHGSQLMESREHPLLFDGYRTHLANNVYLTEQEALIRLHPRIFCAFHYFRLNFLDRKELIEIDALCRVLSASYSNRR